MLPAICASDGQLRLLLNNVLTNSLEAQTCSPHVVELQTIFQNEHIVLIIKDNGCGMDVDTLVKAQAPFFTTKNQSVHSGMGLFSAATIVNNFYGELDIQSQQGVGTTVTITLDLNALSEDDKLSDDLSTDDGVNKNNTQGEHNA
jgi:signal transduction histidine kinase